MRIKRRRDPKRARAQTPRKLEEVSKGNLGAHKTVHCEQLLPGNAFQEGQSNCFPFQT